MVNKEACLEAVSKSKEMIESIQETLMSEFDEDDVTVFQPYSKVHILLAELEFELEALRDAVQNP